MAKPFLTPTEVAEMLMVAPVTVRQWAQKGLIEARTTAGGHRRFTLDAVRAFAARMGIEINHPQDGPVPNRVLVVDDDQQFNGFLVALFAQQFPGYDVGSAYDGFEAGRLLQRLRPQLVLLDIMMPGIDGVEVCRRLKADPDSSAIRVIAMTGHFTPELEQRIRAAGAERLLKKPFSTAELIDACQLRPIE
jgi:excisionase family DNA binding protein